MPSEFRSFVYISGVDMTRNNDWRVNYTRVVVNIIISHAYDTGSVVLNCPLGRFCVKNLPQTSKIYTRKCDTVD